MPSAPPVALLDRPDAVRLALSPIRRRLLARMQQPASATELSAELALGRQRINYHLRALERAGLVSLVETRRKRGCVERVLVATARAFVVDPDVLERAADKTPRGVQDRFASDHLIGAAAGLVRDVARMQARADERRKRLLTFTIETDVHLATPADLQRFSSLLADAVARTAARLKPSAGGRRYRVVIGAYPTPRSPEKAHT
jgi:DNA-binding transcriptional ArsR family regulator